MTDDPESADAEPVLTSSEAASILGIDAALIARYAKRAQHRVEPGDMQPPSPRAESAPR